MWISCTYCAPAPTIKHLGWIYFSICLLPTGNFCACGWSRLSLQLTGVWRNHHNTSEKVQLKNNFQTSPLSSNRWIIFSALEKQAILQIRDYDSFTDVQFSKLHHFQCYSYSPWSSVKFTIGFVVKGVYKSENGWWRQLKNIILV